MAVKLKMFGYAMLLGALFIAAIVPIAYKAASSISVLELILFISLIGTIVSFALMVATGNQRHLKGYFTNRGAFLAMAAFGILAYAFETFALSYATHFVSANLAAVIYRTWPLMIILLAPLIIRERITKYDALAVVIGFSGLAIVMLRGTSISMPSYELPFVAILLLAAFADAVASAIQKRYSYEIYSSLFMYNLIALAIFAPLALAYKAVSLSGLTAPVLSAVLFLGLLQNVALTFFFAKAIRSVKVSTVGNVLLSVPFVTMILSAVLLKEAIMPYYVIIAIATVAGIAVQKLAPNVSNYVPKTKGQEWHIPSIYDVSSAFVNTSNAAIYETIKGSGRALAIYKPKAASAAEAHDALLKSLGAQSGAILFTDRSPVAGVSAEEISFIKELIGYKEGGLIVIGIGNPEELEKILYNVHSFGAQNISSNQSDVS